MKRVTDIYQAKKLAKIYNLLLDELIDFDENLLEIKEIINNSSEEKINKINWTSAWSKKYPVLAIYSNKVDIEKYSNEIRKMLDSLMLNYNFNKLDSMLVLKDILYHEWKDKKC